MSVACQLIAEAPDTTVGITSGWLLRSNADHARMQNGELRPVSAIQGQIDDALLLNRRADNRGVRFNIRCACLHLDMLSRRSNRQRDVQVSDRTHRELQVCLHMGRKARS